jgi:hypothetical protein
MVIKYLLLHDSNAGRMWNITFFSHSINIGTKHGVVLTTYCHLVLLQHESQHSCSMASETISKSLITSKHALPFYYFYSGSSDPVYFTHIFSVYMSALVLPLLLYGYKCSLLLCSKNIHCKYKYMNDSANENTITKFHHMIQSLLFAEFHSQ